MISEECYDSPGSILNTSISGLRDLTEEEKLKAIQDMIKLSDRILFSATLHHIEEPTHVNMQPTEYRIGILGKSDYALNYSYDDSFIGPNAFLFKQRRYLDFSIPRSLRLLTLYSNTNEACAEVQLFIPLSNMDCFR